MKHNPQLSDTDRATLMSLQRWSQEAAAPGICLPAVTIHIKGLCSPNPGLGKFGVLLQSGAAKKELSGLVPDATNNLMELIAAVQAFRVLLSPCRVTLYSNSEWLVKAAEGSRKRASHLDVWQMLDKLTAPHDVHWQWTHARNQQVFNLAQTATASGTL